MAALAPRLSAYGGSYFESYLPRIGQFVLKAVTPSLLHHTSSATSAVDGDLCALPPAALLHAAAGMPATDPWSCSSGSAVLRAPPSLWSRAPSSLWSRADLASSGCLGSYLLMHAAIAGGEVASPHVLANPTGQLFFPPLLDGSNCQLLRSLIACLGDPAVSNLIRGLLVSCFPLRSVPLLERTVRGVHTAAAGGYRGGYSSGAGFSGRVMVLNLDGIVVLNPAGSSGCRGLFCKGLSGLECGRPIFNPVLRESVVEQILKNIGTMISKMHKKIRTMVSKMLQGASDPTLDKLIQVIARGGSLLLEQILKLSKVVFFHIMQGAANPMMRKVIPGMVSLGAELVERLDKIEAYGTRITKYCLVAVLIVTWLSMGLSVRESIDLLVLRLYKKSSLFKQEVLDYRQLCIDKEEAARRGTTVDDLVAARQKALQAEEAARLAAMKIEEEVEATRKQTEAAELAKKKWMEEREESNYRLALLYDHDQFSS